MCDNYANALIYCYATLFCFISFGVLCTGRMQQWCEAHWTYCVLLSCEFSFIVLTLMPYKKCKCITLWLYHHLKILSLIYQYLCCVMHSQHMFCSAPVLHHGIKKKKKTLVGARRRVNRLLLRNNSVCWGKGKHARVIDSILARRCCSIAAAAADGFSI